MKKFSKIFAVLMTLCLLCGIVFALVPSAATVVQDLYVGNDTAGYLDFDNHTSNIYGNGGTLYPNASGSKAMVYTKGMAVAGTISLKNQTVDGRTNKYLDFTAKSHSNSINYYPTFALLNDVAEKQPFDQLYLTKSTDYVVVDMDLKANAYFVVEDGAAVTYNTWEEVVAAGKENEAKLTYPEKLFFSSGFDSYSSETTKAGTSTVKFLYIVSNNGKWYLSTNNSYGSTDIPLSNEAGHWNHLTFVISTPRVDMEGVGAKNRQRVKIYLDGKYVLSYTVENSDSYGQSAGKYSKTRFNRFDFNLLDTTANGGASCYYSFGVDNIAINAYVSYTPSDEVEYSINDFMAADGKGNISDCDDVLYNENYLSPNGNKFTLDWVDLNGDAIVSEKIDIATAPVVDETKSDAVLMSGIKGNANSVSAWEWNVSEDENVFTPVGKLTFAMVQAVRARGDYSVTVRPAVLDVEWLDGETVLGSDKYFAGSTVEPYTSKTNGWYAAEYSAKSNATEGEASDSFIIAAGKDNKFVIDSETAIPTASIEGVRYNMSLLTNYYMNIYVPAETLDGVEVLGFYSDASLANKYDEGVRLVSIGGAIYHELSLGVANSDIDVNVPRYVGIKVTIGENEYELAYEVNVNVLSYCKGVLGIYECNSEESSLVVNLLNYANEAYKLANGADNAAAVATLGAHGECGCLLSGDAGSEYKGNIGSLTNYLYGAAYNVTTTEPALMLYLLSEKAGEVSKITVSYDGIDGEVVKTLAAMNTSTLNGKSVIPYSYSKIAACDVKEVMTITVYGEGDAVLAEGSYSIANYAFNNDVPVANALIAFSKAAAAYKISVFGENDAPVLIEGIEAEKISSLRPSTTLSTGDKITYTIKITNNNSTALDIPVVDKIPANTYYVSGDATVKGQKLYWTVNVGAGETKEISYVVAVDKNSALLDKNIILTAPAANVGGNYAECGDENYIARTINAVDAFYMKAGIDAMSYSDDEVLVALAPLELQEAGVKSPIAVLRFMYNVAFSKTPDINSRATIEDVIKAIFEKTATDAGIKYRAEVAPTLWGGSAVTDVLPGIKGESSAIEEADFVIGDVLFVKDSDGARMYIFDGASIISITNGYECANTNDVITRANAADYYAVLRPTMSMKTLHTSDPDYVNTEELTAQQEALVKTAHQYVLRGTRLQYDDGGIGNSGNSSEYRWQIGKYQPEEYTEQNWRFINCAGFTYDIYRMTLGYDLGGLFTTKALMNYFTNGGAENNQYPFYFQWDADVHADKARQAEVKNELLSTLEVGDLVVVTRDGKVGGYGHVMMYVGNGMLAHSTGSSRGSGTGNTIDNEFYEPTIRYMSVESYLFDPTASNYLFVETATTSTVYQTCIVRPLDKCGNYAIPENTQNRVENLYGIISEKLSSHPMGKTVNKGGEVTFTYKIKNTNNISKVLSVTDVVPENSVLVDAPYAEIDGNNLSWSVVVAPGETVEVSYTVKATGEYGSYIYSAEGKVGGVLHTCSKTYIENTLTTEQQAALLDALEYYKTNNTEGFKNLALVNAIYEKAGLDAPFADGVTAATVKSSLFKTSSYSSSLYEFNTSSGYYDMVVDTLWGGGKFYTKNYYSSTNKTSSDRSRLPREQSLVFGDIIVAEFSSGSSLYMYFGGDNIVSIGQTSASISYDSRPIHNRLQRLLSVGKYYAVLRPSMADTFTVNFNTDGGNSVASVKVSADGESCVSAPQDPVKPAYKFMGWYLGDERYDFSSPVTSDITLTAKWELDESKSIKLLAIGNSYSVDAMRYLYGILEQAGYEDIKLANLYIGGCTLDTHYENMSANNEAYTLYLSSSKHKVMVAESGTYSIEYALGLEDWDIVTLQQRSGDAGNSDTYGNLQNVIDYVKANEPDADIYWHMTWSYGPNYWSESGEEKQISWYNSITSTVQEKILTNGDIVGVIPVGTAIQNLRTSSLGNDLTRDDTHLSYDIGRYTAALTWAAYFTGCDINEIDGTPSYSGDMQYADAINANMELIREAVSNALSNPYSVTESAN